MHVGVSSLETEEYSPKWLTSELKMERLTRKLSLRHRRSAVPAFASEFPGGDRVQARLASGFPRSGPSRVVMLIGAPNVVLTTLTLVRDLELASFLHFQPILRGKAVSEAWRIGLTGIMAVAIARPIGSIPG
jgi:hypothetical protein